MNLSVRFLEAAEQDLVDAWGWYEAQQRGLGDRFVAVVLAAVEVAARWPNAAAPVVRDRSGNVVERAIPTDGFPYVVRYRVRRGGSLDHCRLPRAAAPRVR